MYLEAPAKTWYDSQDGLKPTERNKTEDQRLEKAYKDNELKRIEDPMMTMQAYLARRDEIKAAQERQKANPWDDTPRTLKSDRTPVEPSRLFRRKDQRHYRPPSPEGEPEVEGPVRPSSFKQPVSTEEAARRRESSERERARALLAARKRDNASEPSSTPRSDFGYQTGMYNRAETRDAKRYSGLRWDEERRDSRRYHR